MLVSHSHYMVFNWEKLNFKSIPAKMAAHSGRQFLAAFSSLNKANDDWLISPKLSGNAQKISFFAKSLNSKNGNETFEVLCSSKGRETEDFEIIGEQHEPNDTTWEKYEFSLPKGTNHFAIRCVSKDKMIFMLDDIDFENGDMVIDGYKIYRNNKMIASLPASQNTYVDELAPEGQNTYHVTVVYNIGESDYSNPKTITATRDIIGNNYSIEKFPNGVKINVVPSQLVKIYSLNGILVYKELVEQEKVINLPTGIYIIWINGKTCKINIK